jgi:hypothetical protein
MPAFSLPDTISGRTLDSSALAGKPSVVIFICNHCPFVKHIRAGLAEFGRIAGARACPWSPSARTMSPAIPTTRPRPWPRGRQRGLHFSVPLRRVASRGQGLRRPLHARSVHLRQRRQAGLPRAIRRCPPRQRRSQSPAATPAPPWIPLSPAGSQRPVKKPASAAASSGSPATSRREADLQNLVLQAQKRPTASRPARRQILVEWDLPAREHPEGADRVEVHAGCSREKRAPGVALGAA